MKTSRRKFIAVAGNMGVGKTELVSFLCRRYELTPFYEPNEANPYLQDFYRDMRAWAFHSQVYFLTHKFRLHRQLEREPGTVVQDRTIYEDAEIFARNLHLQRHISARDWRTYQELYEVVSAALQPPDLMIQLRASVRTVRKRIRLRGRPEEQAVPLRYLRRLNDLYDAWFRRWSLCEVLAIDTDRLDYLADLVDRIDLLERIERYL
ncbi:MAG TPA: deoxynucleoside kinase [Myxococcota bacterium]|jgi:deoxyadenosine/deoxycytidine kinase|nr:deoxynucleoside kinase [Myxococcota bacterium]